jgi:hypothetical protein
MLKAAIREEVRLLMEEAVITIRIPVLAQARLEAPAAVSVLGANLDHLRIECGWSFNDMYVATGISKKLSIGHIRHSKGVTPRNVKVYADAFAKTLKRPVTVRQLFAAA